ncbi:hypothetical protein [Carboxylicivirga sp. N1Y90]|uniref:hypothetical protein n=1 Tax=Carboxylicivirga fragile TaxID=3417571 RepID=UPI003D346583|nr:hypothetical protein [Marinilabiliaceae bacterium N1Y90]
MKTSLLLWCMAALLSMPTLLNAQDKKETRKFYVVVDEVKPSKYLEYKEAVTGFRAFLEEKSYPYPVYIFSDDEFNFYYNYPVGKSFASLDSLFSDWDQHYQKDKAGWDRTFDAFNGNYHGSTECIMTWVESLSYTSPSGARGALDYPLTDVMAWYVLPGQMKEAKQLMKDWVKLYQDNNIDLGFSTYVGGLGSDRPMMWIISRFKDRTEYGAMTDVANKQLEEVEGMKELWAKTIKITRKIENSLGWYQDKLSYIPEE